jgi:hypothetical protein
MGMRKGLRVAVLVCETPGIQALRACWRLLEPSIQASTGIEAAEGLSSASPSCGPGDRQRMRIARTAVRRRALATDLDSVPGRQRTGCMNLDVAIEHEEAKNPQIRARFIAISPLTRRVNNRLESTLCRVFSSSVLRVSNAFLRMKIGSVCTSIVDTCRHRGQLVPQFDSAHPSVGITQQKGH